MNTKNNLLMTFETILRIILSPNNCTTGWVPSRIHQSDSSCVVCLYICSMTHTLICLPKTACSVDFTWWTSSVSVVSSCGSCWINLCITVSCSNRPWSTMDFPSSRLKVALGRISGGWLSKLSRISATGQEEVNKYDKYSKPGQILVLWPKIIFNFS